MYKGFVYGYFRKDIELLLYIGSTVNPNKRHPDHKSNLKKGKEMFFYKYLREQSLTFDDLSYECIKVNVKDKIELRRLEGKLIQQYYPLCNKEIAGRTKKEYRQDNQDIKKQYRLNNKEEISKRKKEYNLNHKEEISKQKKEYHQNNKDILNKKSREWRALQKLEPLI